MFCSKCGKQQADNAVFCSSCGNPLSQADATDAQPEGATQAPVNMPPAPNVPPVTPAPKNVPPTPKVPKKSNARLIVLLSVAAVVIIGAVITFVFILPSSQPVSGTLPSATLFASASTSANPNNTAGSGSVALRVYATPTLDNGSSISSVLHDKTWALAGIAHNPDQVKGEAGRYSLSKFSSNATRLVFSADSSSLTISEATASGGSSEEKTAYTVSGLNYCDTARDGQGNTMRFYIATDGNLYRTTMSGNDAVSDYAVFTPSP